MRIFLVFSLAFILIATSVSSVSADIEIVVPGTDDTTLFPIIVGNKSRSINNEVPFDICVANDGTIFVVAANLYYSIIRGPTYATFFAWRNNGSVRWAHSFSSFDRVLYDIETDETNVFVVGGRGTTLFLGKYDYDGNSLWNFTRSMGNVSYGIEYGFRLALLADKTIIVNGISMNYSDSSASYFVAAFDQDGNFQWQLDFQTNPSTCCDSNFIYLNDNGLLQKRDSDGSIIWSRVWSDGSPAQVQDNILYTTEHQGTIPTTSLNVSRWNLDTGQEQWSRNFRLCDTNQQVYNSSGMDFEVAQDGSMMILEGIIGRAGLYLIHINQDGNLASHLSHLNVSLSSPQLELDNDGLIYLAGVSHEGASLTGYLSLAIFNAGERVPVSTTLNGEPFHIELTDVQLLGLVAVGVIGFDAALIIFLWKKY